LTQAAPHIQRSAHPLAYADDEAAATVLYTAVGSTNSRAIPEDLEQFVSTPGCLLGGEDGQPIGEDASLPADWALPSQTPRAIVIAIGWALAQRGTPYSYGGDCTAAHSGIAAHRCDCSSLVQTAYRAASVSLPRTTTEQVRVGVPVADLSQVRPGDLVFIPGSDGTVDAPGHVALYIGNGVAVHAPHRGEVVRLVRIADWRSVIVSVRRLVS
jgi:cell wall-associated NlpC family hydrolase